MVVERESQPLGDDREPGRVDAECSPRHLDGALEPQTADGDLIFPRSRRQGDYAAFAPTNLFNSNSMGLT